MRDVFLRMAVIAGVFVSAQAVSAQSLPSEGYVDPHVAGRDRCLDHPGRPGWMMVQPMGFEWRLHLANDFRSFHRTAAITGIGSCDCDLLYPDWDEYRTDLEMIWAMVSDRSRYEWDDGERSRYASQRDLLSDYSRPLIQEVTKLCVAVE